MSTRTKQIPIGFAPAHLDQLRQLASARGVSVAHVVRAAVAAYLVDPDADLRRQLLAAPAAPAVAAPAPEPPPGIWRRPAADPLAPRC